MGDVSTSGAGIFTGGQLGVDAPQLNAIQGNSVINPSFYSGKPAETQNADSDVLLVLTPGGQYNQILYSNFFTNSKWLRQALGKPLNNTIINGDFTTWQWGTNDPGAANGDYLADHWVLQSALGTGVVRMKRTDLGFAGALSLPNGYVPKYSLEIDCTTAQASIAAANKLYVCQPVEVTYARKLFGGSSSAQIWVNTNLTGTYSFFIQNAGGTQTFKQDFNVGTPNVWTQLTLPNIPVFPTLSSGWGTTESDLSYIIGICLVAGSNFQGAAQSTWSANNLFASASQVNFLSANTNTFQMCLCQHEQGSVVTTFEPVRTQQTMVECQRYAIGFVLTPLGIPELTNLTYAPVLQFPVPMRAVPTLVAGASFTVSGGNVGTPALVAGAGQAPSVQSALISNSANNWTANANQIAFSGILRAELI